MKRQSDHAKSTPSRQNNITVRPSHMNRREFLNRSTAVALAVGSATKAFVPDLLAETSSGGSQTSTAIPPGSVMPGTAPLTMQGDMASEMVDGIRRFLLHKMQTREADRAQLWSRDYSSPEHYERSVASNRHSFQHIIGAEDKRIAPPSLQLTGTASFPLWFAQGKNYRVYSARWSVLPPVTADSGGLEAEGLLLEPEKPPVARVVAIPDADWTPEMLVGLAEGVSPQ